MSDRQRRYTNIVRRIISHFYLILMRFTWIFIFAGARVAIKSVRLSRSTILCVHSVHVYIIFAAFDSN